MKVSEVIFFICSSFVHQRLVGLTCLYLQMDCLLSQRRIRDAKFPIPSEVQKACKCRAHLRRDRVKKRMSSLLINDIIDESMNVDAQAQPHVLPRSEDVHGGIEDYDDEDDDGVQMNNFRHRDGRTMFRSLQLYSLALEPHHLLRTWTTR